MKDSETGVVLSDKELIKIALDHMADALCFVFETESDEGHALAFMLDSAIKYGQVIYHGDNVLSASADYTAYEQEIFDREQEQKKKKIKKLRTVK